MPSAPPSLEILFVRCPSAIGRRGYTGFVIAGALCLGRKRGGARTKTKGRGKLGVYCGARVSGAWKCRRWLMLKKEPLAGKDSI